MTTIQRTKFQPKNVLTAVMLVIGIVGFVASFPSAVNAGECDLLQKAIISITQQIDDAITESMKKNLRDSLKKYRAKYNECMAENSSEPPLCDPSEDDCDRRFIDDKDEDLWRWFKELNEELTHEVLIMAIFRDSRELFIRQITRHFELLVRMDERDMRGNQLDMKEHILKNESRWSTLASDPTRWEMDAEMMRYYKKHISEFPDEESHQVGCWTNSDGVETCQSSAQ